MSNYGLEPKDPNFENKVRESFSKQKVMQTIGAYLKTVKPGEVEIELPFHNDLTQQNNFLHAGILTTIVDSACGYAAFSLMEVGTDVLTIEFKINFLSPALGEVFLAKGLVNKPGKTITVCSGEVIAKTGDKEKVVATMLATMMTMRN
jgi:uncharacterized protein (TIGR00369 family)